MTGGQQAPVLVTGRRWVSGLGDRPIAACRGPGRPLAGPAIAIPSSTRSGSSRSRATWPTPRSVSRAVAGCSDSLPRGGQGGHLGPLSAVPPEQRGGDGERDRGLPRSTACGGLIYTSSPSVVFTGHDLEGVDESVPYASEYDAAYPATKAIAEKLVLANNDATLATVSLRPHLIWGPGDNNILPRIFARARAGRLFRIGRRNPLIDLTYIDNAALAHCWPPTGSSPARRSPARPTSSPRASPCRSGTWSIGSSRSPTLPPVTRSVPLPLAVLAGGVLEALYTLFAASRRAADDAVPGPRALHGALVQPGRRPPRPGILAAGQHRGRAEAARRIGVRWPRLRGQRTETAGRTTMTRSVYAIATMDTKGQELAFVAERLRAAGVPVVTVDVGTLASALGTG